MSEPDNVSISATPDDYATARLEPDSSVGEAISTVLTRAGRWAEDGHSARRSA